MEKQSFISSRQLITILVVTRSLFSTAYICALNAGNSVQDILVAVPVIFLMNFIVAIPILLLLKKYPGKDPVECAINVMGKPIGVLIAILYMVYFLFLSIMTQSEFQVYYVNSIIPESKYYAIAIPMLLICVYGAIKGIEALSRFGGLALAVYVITLIVIFFSLIPNIQVSNLSPLFYNGPQYVLKAIWNGFNQDMQIVFLAFCAPFLKVGTKVGKVYTVWNLIAMLLFLALEFNIVVVMGAFGAKQNFPLQTLATQSTISVFERLDQLDMVSWIINTVLTTAFYIYLASVCLLKTGLNKHRKIITFACALAVYVAAWYFSKRYNFLRTVTLNTKITIITFLMVILIPLLILIVGAVKRRAENEEAH